MFPNESGPLCGNREPNPKTKLSLYSNCSVFWLKSKSFAKTLSGCYSLWWQPIVTFFITGGGGHDI